MFPAAHSAKDAQVPDGNTTRTSTTAGTTLEFLNPGESVQVTVILSPCKANHSWVETGLNRSPNDLRFIPQNLQIPTTSSWFNSTANGLGGKFMNIVDIAPFRAQRVMSTNRDARPLEDTIDSVSHIGGLDFLNKGEQNGTQADYGAASTDPAHPDDRVCDIMLTPGMGKNADGTPMSEVTTAAGTHVAWPELTALTNEVYPATDSIGPWGDGSDQPLGVVKLTQKRMSTPAFVQESAEASFLGVEGALQNRTITQQETVSEVDTMYTPHIVLAICQVGRAYTLVGGTWQLDATDTTKHPAPAMTPADVWKGLLVKEIDATHRVLYVIKRTFTPMIGGLFPPEQVLSGEIDFRLVGASLRLSTGGVSNNLLFSSISEMEESQKFPSHDQLHAGFQTPYNTMHMDRPGSRMSRNHAYAVYGCDTNASYLKFQNCSVTTDERRKNGKQTCPFAIGSANSLGQAISQQPVPLEISAVAHWELRAHFLKPTSRASPAYLSAVHSTEALVRNVHGTRNPVAAQNGHTQYKGMVAQVMNLAGDHMVRNWLPHALNVGTHLLERAAGRALGIGPASLPMIAD